MNFTIDKKEYPVVINCKKIKHIYIRIKDNTIIVNANKSVSDKYIIDLLNKEINVLRKMLDGKPKVEENKVYYLGNELVYHYQDNKIKVNQFECYGPSTELINEFLEKNSLSLFEKRLENIKPLFSNLPKFRLRIRKMKTRWGVCNKKSMTVTLNTELIHKDVTLIDYVIVHELCHFKYMDHSKLFWQEVEKYYPYYKKARKMLKD